MNETTKEELLSIVKQISDLELERVEVYSEIQKLTRERSHIMLQAEIKIFQEVDEKGKAKYPNESLRKAAANLYLYPDNQYQKLNDRLLEIRLKDKKLAIKCVDLKASYQVLIAYLTPPGERVSFPSLQLEDLDLLTAATTLPEKLQRLAWSSSGEVKATSTQLTEAHKNELLRIRNQLSDLESKKEEFGKERHKVSRQIRIIEDKARLEIAAKRDAKGKPAYSTESTRDAAIRLKLEESIEHQQLAGMLRKIDDEADKFYEEMLKLRDRETVLLSGSTPPV